MSYQRKLSIYNNYFEKYYIGQMDCFKCDICDYATNRQYNLSLHKTTLKHKTNEKKIISLQKELIIRENIIAQKSINENISKQDVISTEHNCKFCGKKFKHYQSKWKHEKFRCNKKLNISNLINENDELIKENLDLKCKLEEIMTVISK